MSSQFMEVPPADCLKLDNPAEADAARRRVSKKPSGLFKAISLPNIRRSWHGSLTSSARKGKRRASTSDQQQDDIGVSEAIQLPHDVPIKDLTLPEDRDVYRWAVVHENQRGITIFSAAYYSPLSLLPIDPPAFTLAEAEDSGEKQAQASLNEYPLPDGTWRWVSNAWMIDMRSEGEVQYDGFEYNWFFRKHHWRAQVGPLSSGGWVRRRRWVRLMMRPARTVKTYQEVTASRLSQQPWRPEPMDEEQPEGRIWIGDEGDWERCRNLMKTLRDGKRLEVWKIWLLDPPDSPQKGKERQQASEQEVSREHEKINRFAAADTRPSRGQITKILNNHGSEIMHMFVYPQSRVEFIRLLADTNLLRELNSSPDHLSNVSQAVDFWSYTSNLSEFS